MVIGPFILCRWAVRHGAIFPHYPKIHLILLILLPAAW